MKLYVCMVLSGSICTLLYIIFNCILPCEFSLKWKNILIRSNIMFYLLPFPWIMARLKENVKVLMDMAGISFPSGKIADVINTKNVWESVVVENADGKVLYITGYQKLLPVIGIMTGIFLIMTVGWMIAYLVVCGYYRRNAIYLDASEYLKNIKWKKKIYIGISEQASSPVTVGIIKPTILFPINREKYEDAMEGIIQHELRHIWNLDVLFRFFTFAVVAVQWYNPLAYYLLWESIAVSELLCDKAATADMSKEEKVCYMKCIVAAVEKQQNPKTLIVTLGGSKGLSKRRLKTIMNKNEKKFWKRSFTAGILIICFIVSGIPVLAYEEPVKHTYDNNVSKDWANINEVTFAPGRTGTDEGMDIEIDLSNSVFTNEAGETYLYDNSELNSENQMRLTCLHTYQAGTHSTHEKSGDGCVVIVYNAKRCSKCGNLVIGSEIERHSYKVCPH